MDQEEQPDSVIPLVAGSAPLVRLVSQSAAGAETAIACRRVVTLLGSRTGCKLVLPHRRVAAVHAAIVHTGPDVYAVDLVTKYGTLLNGLKLEHERLSDGDRLAICSWELRVTVQQHERTGSADIHPFDLEPTPHVIALEHLATHRILQPNRGVCIIGRRNGCDITVNDNTVSRTHALLFTYFGYAAVFDLLSRNGTFVNGTRVGFRVLQDSDTITVGDTQFRARLVSPGTKERGDSRRESSYGSGDPGTEGTQDLVRIRAPEGERPREIDVASDTSAGRRSRDGSDAQRRPRDRSVHDSVEDPKDRRHT